MKTKNIQGQKIFNVTRLSDSQKKKLISKVIGKGVWIKTTKGIVVGKVHSIQGRGIVIQIKQKTDNKANAKIAGWGGDCCGGCWWVPLVSLVAIGCSLWCW